MTRFALPLALLALASSVAAQTSTKCNPLHQSCPSDPALGTTLEMVFNETMTEFDSNLFTVIAGESLISFTEDGAEFPINKQGDSVTVRTAFYIFFGHIEVIFKAASGQGIISTINTLSDDLDEIDVEIMGGNTTYGSCNYYGWGNTSEFNSLYFPTTGPSFNGGLMGDFHNYTISWTQDQLQWYLDDQIIRTQPYQPPGQWPQTPSYLNIGIWAGGDPNNPEGTIQWAGGETDYSKGPFVMTIKSLKIVDGTQNAASYSYGDGSGTYESINVTPGQSDAYKAITDPTFSSPSSSSSSSSSPSSSSSSSTTTQNVEHKWTGLSTGAKIAIAASLLGVFALASILFIFYCIKQRRDGKREKALADEAWDAQQRELLEYRNRMQRGDFAVGFMGHGEKF